MFTNSVRWMIPTLALLLMLTACGLGSGGVVTLDGTEDGSSATPAPSVDPEEAIFAFSDCMREHGVDVPDPQVVEGGGGGGLGFRADPSGAPAIDRESEEFQAAMEACRDLLDGFAAGPGNGPELTEEQEQAMIDFAECMREHGIDMPDPVNGGITFGLGDGEEGAEPPFDPQSPEFQEANEACRDLLGDFGPRTEVRQ
jgi:hypothetical protein